MGTDNFKFQPVSFNNSVVYNQTEKKLAAEIQLAVHKQRIHAYNIANVSTPGFRPITFSDELKNAEGKQGTEFHLEEETHKMTKNRFHHSACVKALSALIAIKRKVATQGKQ